MKQLFSILLVVAVVVVAAIAHAQQPKKVARIGYLSSTDPATESARAEAIRLALRELGYIEGQNIAIEYRYAEGKHDRVPELAAELVRLKVDIIVVAGGNEWIRAAKNATKTIPIVMVGTGSDPVEAGLIESLARPGGNVTGLTLLSRELGGKRLELLKEAVPKVARVAVLYDPANPPSVHRGERGSPSRGARAGVDYSTLGGTSCGRFREGICRAEQAAPGWTLRDLGPANDVLTQKRIVGFALKSRLPASVQQQRSCRCRRAHVLRGGPRGQLPARSILRGQDPEGSQACRSAGGAADEVRAGDQSQNGEADRSDDSAESAGAERTESFAEFWIFDFRLGSGRQKHDKYIFDPISGLLLRQSKIGNRKSKIGWGYR